MVPIPWEVFGLLCIVGDEVQCIGANGNNKRQGFARKTKQMREQNKGKLQQTVAFPMPHFAGGANVRLRSCQHLAKEQKEKTRKKEETKQSIPNVAAMAR